MTRSSTSLIRDALVEPSTWQWVGATLVSALLVGGLIGYVGVERLWRLFGAMRIGPMVGAVSAYTGVLAIRWVRLAGLLPERLEGWPTPRLLWVTAGHSFANQLMPLRSGELAFPVLLQRAESCSLTEGAVYLTAIRLVELGCLIPIYAAGLGVWWVGQSGTSPLGWPLYLALGGTLVFVALLPMLLTRGFAAVDWVLHRPELETVDWLDRPREALTEAERAVERLDRRRLLWLVATSTLMWVSMFGVFYCTLAAFGAGTGWAQTIVGSGGGIVGNLLPINGIGSLGTMEAGWLAAFRATGAPKEPVVAAGLVVHAIVIFGTGAATLVGLGFDGSKT